MLRGIRGGAFADVQDFPEGALGHDARHGGVFRDTAEGEPAEAADDGDRGQQARPPARAELGEYERHERAEIGETELIARRTDGPRGGVDDQRRCRAVCRRMRTVESVVGAAVVDVEARCRRVSVFVIHKGVVQTILWGTG